MVFGNKDNFAIEICGTNIESSLLSIHLGNNEFGNSKILGELRYASQSLSRLIDKTSEFENPKVDDMNPTSFFNWLLADDLINENSEDSSREFVERHKHVLFLGDQMDGFSIFCSINNESIRFCIYDVKKGKTFSKSLEFSEVKRTVTEFIQWFNTEQKILYEN